MIIENILLILSNLSYYICRKHQTIQTNGLMIGLNHLRLSLSSVVQQVKHIPLTVSTISIMEIVGSICIASKIDGGYFHFGNSHYQLFHFTNSDSTIQRCNVIYPLAAGMNWYN